MVKILYRIIALVLIPCLLADPSLASALTSQPLKIQHPADISPRFTEQAVVQGLLQFGRRSFAPRDTILVISLTAAAILTAAPAASAQSFNPDRMDSILQLFQAGARAVQPSMTLEFLIGSAAVGFFILALAGLPWTEIQLWWKNRKADKRSAHVKGTMHGSGLAIAPGRWWGEVFQKALSSEKIFRRWLKNDYSRTALEQLKKVDGDAYWAAMRVDLIMLRELVGRHVASKMETEEFFAARLRRKLVNWQKRGIRDRDTLARELRETVMDGVKNLQQLHDPFFLKGQTALVTAGTHPFEHSRIMRTLESWGEQVIKDFKNTLTTFGPHHKATEVKLGKVMQELEKDHALHYFSAKRGDPLLVAPPAARGMRVIPGLPTPGEIIALAGTEGAWIRIGDWPDSHPFYATSDFGEIIGPHELADRAQELNLTLEELRLAMAIPDTKHTVIFVSDEKSEVAHQTLLDLVLHFLEKNLISTDALREPPAAPAPVTEEPHVPHFNSLLSSRPAFWVFWVYRKARLRIDVRLERLRGLPHVEGPFDPSNAEDQKLREILLDRGQSTMEKRRFRSLSLTGYLRVSSRRLTYEEYRRILDLNADVQSEVTSEDRYLSRERSDYWRIYFKHAESLGDEDDRQNLVPVRLFKPMSPEEVVAYLRSKGAELRQVTVESLRLRALEPGQSSLHIGSGLSFLPVAEALMGLNVTVIDSNKNSVDTMSDFLDLVSLDDPISIRQKIEQRSGGQFNYSPQNLIGWTSKRTFNHMVALDFTRGETDLIRLRMLEAAIIRHINTEVPGSTILASGAGNLETLATDIRKVLNRTVKVKQIDKDVTGTDYAPILLTITPPMSGRAVSGTSSLFFSLLMATGLWLWLTPSMAPKPYGKKLTAQAA